MRITVSLIFATATIAIAGFFSQALYERLTSGQEDIVSPLVLMGAVVAIIAIGFTIRRREKLEE